MNRQVLIIGGAVLAAFCAAMWLRPSDSVSVRPIAAAPEISKQERGRVTTFWTIYRTATAEKQDGRWEDAARDYQRALELAPDHWDSLYYLGNCLIELKRFPAAEKAYVRLAASDNVAARAHSALGALYSMPDAGPTFSLPKAAVEYEAARHANADESGSVLRLGEVSLAMGETQAARDYLRAAGATNFKSVNAAFLLGYIAWEKGDKSTAHAKFAEAVFLTKAQKPPAGVLGEGDTHLPGHAAMTLPGQRGLFDRIIGGLWKQRDSSPQRMDSLYSEVKDYLSSLRRPPS